MAYREIIIKLRKCTLVLYENELWQLPPETLKKAIGRGKALKRCERVENYNKNKGDV